MVLSQGGRPQPVSFRKRQKRTFAAPSSASASAGPRSPSCHIITSASPTCFMCVRSDAIDALRVFAWVAS